MPRFTHWHRQHDPIGQTIDRISTHLEAKRRVARLRLFNLIVALNFALTLTALALILAQVGVQ